MTLSRKEMRVAFDTRWERARSACLRQYRLAQATTTVGELARIYGLPWFDRLDGERVATYLSFDYRTLMSRYGFGSKKFDLLIAILEAAAANEAGTGNGTSAESIPRNAQDTLRKWQVPGSFPVELIRLPARVLGFCANKRVANLGELIAVSEALGVRGLLEQENLGRKSVDELFSFMDALQRGDAAGVRRWLPLAPDSRGLSLAIAVQRMIAGLPLHHRPLLERRLVLRMTLEEAAGETGLTRERIRQVARDFLLEPLQRLLDWFPKEQQLLLQAWLRGTDLVEVLGPFSSVEDQSLAIGAISAIFEEAPEGVASRLNQETQFESWHDALKGSAEFQTSGVELQEFLDRQVPQQQHGAFLEFLMERPGFAIDHTNGRIMPDRCSLRLLVLAILQEQDDPMPVTLLLRMLQSSAFHRKITADNLMRRYRNWLQRYPDFPRDRILWQE